MKCSVCESDDISVLEIDSIMFCTCRACGHKWRQIKRVEFTEKCEPTIWTFAYEDYPLEAK